MLAAAVGGVCHGAIVGGMSAMFVELFPTAARYTGFSLGYQLATVAAGAVAPLIGVALLTAYGSDDARVAVRGGDDRAGARLPRHGARDEKASISRRRSRGGSAIHALRFVYP